MQLEIVNKNLEAYYNAWDKFIKSWIVIKIKDPSYVYQWRLQVSCKYIIFSLSENATARSHLTSSLGRLQAEIAMRDDGKPGMSDEEVNLRSILEICNTLTLQSLQIELFAFLMLQLQIFDFVSRYLPAYKAYLPTLYAEGPSGSDPEHLLVVEIDEGRNPILAN